MIDALRPTYRTGAPWPDYGARLGFFTDQQAVEAYGAGCQKIADAALSSARKAAEQAGVACDTLHVANSVPGKAILETAAARSCDLIVLTSHGRHGFERFLIAVNIAENRPPHAIARWWWKVLPKNLPYLRAAARV